MIDYTSLKEYVTDCIINNVSKKDMYEIAQLKFEYKSDFSSFRKFVNRIISKVSPKIIESDEIDIPSFIATLKRLKVCNVSDIANQLNCPPKRITQIVEAARSNGYDIIIDSDKVIYTTELMPEIDKIKRLENKEISFGIASDLHFGSKACQITALNSFCNICKNNNVKHIFIPGDVLSGNSVYPGHVYDLYAVSADEQINSCLTNLPTGFEWYAIGGNHDYSYVKKSGQNPLLIISSFRDDIHYLGFDSVDVPILKNVDIRLFHPSGGIPYSYSYRLQKTIEQITISELQSIVRGLKDKPTVRFVLAGHLHIQVQAMFGSIWGAQCGAFEGQTNYLKRKGLVPSIGGYIVKASLGKNGLLKNFEAKFYIFDDIEDDYKNYKHSYTYGEVIDPIFE